MLWCGGVWDISFPYTIEPFLTPTPSERRETALVNTICSWPGAALVLYGAQRSHRTDTCSPLQNHPSPLTPPRCWMYHRAAPAPRNCVRVLLLCHPWAAGTALHSPQQSLQQWQHSWITSQAGDLSLLSLSITFIKSCRRSLLQCTQASSQSALAAPWPYNLISPTCRGVCDWCTLHSPSQHSCPQAGTRSHKHGHSWTTDSSRFFPVTTTSINNQGFFLSFVVCIMWHLNSLYTNSSSALIVCFCTVIN